MSQVLKVAVIGVGHLGKCHADKYAASPDCQLLAVADSDIKVANQTAQRLGAQAYSDYHDILPLVDAVSLAVPTCQHYKIARDILEAGIHCLIEKPISETCEEADKLIEIARHKHRVLQIGHIVRFNSVMTDIENLLNTPLFIESTRIAPFTTRATDISVILDLMIHDIDLIQELVDSPIKTISASGSSVLSNSIDIANARIGFENGCAANVTASRISHKHEQKLRIFQKDTYISADLKYNKLSIYRKSETTNETGIQDIAHEQRNYEDNDALNLEIVDFIHAIKTNGKPKVTGEDGKRALETAIAITSQINQAP
jgi:predicted dehydrogenase